MSMINILLSFQLSLFFESVMVTSLNMLYCNVNTYFCYVKIEAKYVSNVSSADNFSFMERHARQCWQNICFLSEISFNSILRNI